MSTPKLSKTFSITMELHFNGENFIYQFLKVLLNLHIRLLHPQHLGGIWIGQNQYRLPLAPLNEFPEPWCLKVADG